MPDLRTIQGVELVKTGRWKISTGEWRVTAADLASAVAAHRAGILRKPVVKLGHTGMGDAAPALGYVDNLRTTDGGDTLIGDLVNVPAAVAKLLPMAYPDRSVEALRHYTDHTGRTWPLVLDGLALLGATAPGVGALKSLQDVGELYGVAASRVSIPAPAPARPHIIAGTARLDTRVRVAAARRARTQRPTTKG